MPADPNPDRASSGATADVNPLVRMAEDAGVASRLRAARAAVAAVHRRPVNLRRYAVTSAESVLRGARASAMIATAEGFAGGEASAIDASSLLAPDALAGTVRTFRRAPLQVIARIDVLAGGSGRPAAGSAGGLESLAKAAGRWADHELVAALWHGTLMSLRPFGERTGVVARLVARIAAISSGFDPRGLAVPEPYLNRHREQYLRSAAGFAEDPAARDEFLALYVESWAAGAREAEGIARAAS